MEVMKRIVAVLMATGILFLQGCGETAKPKDTVKEPQTEQVKLDGAETETGEPESETETEEPESETSQEDISYPDGFVAVTDEQAVNIPDVNQLGNTVVDALSKIGVMYVGELTYGNYAEDSEKLALDIYTVADNMKKMIISVECPLSAEVKWKINSIKGIATGNVYYIDESLDENVRLYDYRTGKALSESEPSENTEEKEDVQNVETETQEVSALFQEVYLPYAKREKPFIFEAVKTFAQNVDKYTVKIMEPSADAEFSIKFTDKNNDDVYIAFAPDENALFTVMLVNYHQDSTNREVSLSNYSSDGSPEYDEFTTQIVGEGEAEVSGIDEQQDFLFKK